MRQSLVNRIALLATILIFGAAVAVLFNEFRSVSPGAVLAFVLAMPGRQIGSALGLTAASYLLLTGYDFLALRYVRQHLPWRDVVFASFTAFAFSNNIGMQLLSGGSMRYRLYSNLGISGGDILRIVAFCTFTYALGVITVGGLVFLLEPAEIASRLRLSQPVISAIGIVLLVFSLGYLAVAARWRKPMGFRNFRLRPPSLMLAIAQLALASLDAVLAGTVFFVLLPADTGLGFSSYLGIYMVAATISVLSLVPGGLGVFETAITLMTAPPTKAAALGAFLAYRVIYFMIPFGIAILGFALHEMRRRLEKT